MNHVFTLNGFRCTVLDVSHFVMTADVLFPHAAPDDRAARLAAHDLDPDRIVFQTHPLLVETGQHKILIDPGSNADEHGNPANLLTALGASGINPATIDAVVISHCHPDHYSGGAFLDGTPTFPNARYCLHRAEWAYWLATDNPETDFAAIFRQVLLPIQDRIVLLDGDAAIVPGIRLLDTPGHSPGHVAVLVGDRLVYVGDVLLNVIHVEHPTWTATFDRWLEDVVQSRGGLLHRAAAENLLVATYHFPLPGLGRVQPDGDGWRWIAAEAANGDFT